MSKKQIDEAGDALRFFLEQTVPGESRLTCERKGKRLAFSIILDRKGIADLVAGQLPSNLLAAIGSSRRQVNVAAKRIDIHISESPID